MENFQEIQQKKVSNVIFRVIHENTTGDLENLSRDHENLTGESRQLNGWSRVF
jgi:hypothetical protein